MESKIECLICGDWFYKLSQTHLSKHGISPVEYKTKFGIKTTNSPSLFLKEQRRAIDTQFNKVVAGLLRDGFILLNSQENYQGVHRSNELKCVACGHEFSSKLGDKRKIICRNCVPLVKKRMIPFKYVNSLDDFSFVKEEMSKTVCGIYVIKNSTNGKFYIGSSSDIRQRWAEHKSKLNKRRHVNTCLQNSWNKYGGDLFEFLVLEKCEPSELFVREQYFLDTLKPFRDVGYNISEIAGGGDIYKSMCSADKSQFLKIMKILTSGERNPMFGRKHSIESKNKQKLAAKGRFSLAWFLNKYGESEGKVKWEERSSFLKSRHLR